MANKCPKCNADNPDTKQFCGDCGTQLPSLEDIKVTETIEAPKEELTTGSTFADRYQIIEELGKGGMGRVYRVIDKELKEEVALKLIKPEIASDKKTLERFNNELRLSRKIVHKNVGRMYELMDHQGTRFITMEYVAGEDLRSSIRRFGQLPIAKSISITKQICEGLSEAHRLGVVHRDLKSNNIMIDKEGNARIMDFGIARSLEAKGITGAGVMIGTPEYMSPEQVEGKEVDQRSDIYSLGVILYEMLTGQVPFEGDTPFTIGVKHKSEMPKNPKEINTQIPDDLSLIILRCLEKKKEKRYQTAGEVWSELENMEKGITTTERKAPEKIPFTSKEITVTVRKPWMLIVSLAAVVIVVVLGFLYFKGEKQGESPVTSLPGEKMLVVLPFENLGSPEDEYFADGITEEISSRLAAVRDLRIISRTSAMQYKHKRPSLKQIGIDLGVDYVLEGTVRWARGADGSRVRITPQLIRVSDDSQLWADSYDRVIDDIFKIHTDIAKQVIQKLEVTLLEPERLALEVNPTENLAAYQAFLRARELSRSLYPSQEEAESVVRLYKRAVELDPGFAQAWADLSRFHARQYYVGMDHTEVRLNHAKQTLERALEADPELPAVILAQGYYYYHCLEDYNRALEQFLVAAESIPSEGIIAMGLVYRRLGRWEEAISAFEQAAELDPKSQIPISNLGNVLAAQKRFAEAERMYEQALTIAPDVVDTFRLNAWNLLYWKGATQEAWEFLKSCPKQDHFYVISTKAWCDYYDREYKDTLMKLEDRVFDSLSHESRRQLLLGCAYLQLNRREAARRALESVVEIRELQLKDIPEESRSRNLNMVELALAYALLGRKNDAIHLAQLGVDLNAHDSFEGPGWSALLAWVYVITGEDEAALELIEKLLNTPHAHTVPYAWAITAAVLRYHPDLDPLRDHPHFQELLNKYE